MLLDEPRLGSPLKTIFRLDVPQAAGGGIFTHSQVASSCILSLLKRLNFSNSRLSLPKLLDALEG